MYKDFDLPSRIEAKGAPYVPPKARDDDEIERRRRLPTGTLLAEAQRDGVAIAADILADMEDPADLAFASRLLGASALNTSWYLFAEGAPVMRRRLKLPLLATEGDIVRPDTIELVQARDRRLAEARRRADTHTQMVAFALAEAARDDSATNLGRLVGNTGLSIATVDLGDVFTFGQGDNFEVQDAVRERSLQTLRDARELGIELHTIPSLAQLADPDSDLSVFWRRQAPNGAYRAYCDAIDRRAA